ncbi:hypothetical protein SRHO_G00150080 [Serrasalmus rhombeus]
MNETLCVIGNKLQRLKLQDGAQDGVVAELKKKNQKPQPKIRDKTKAKEKLQKMMCAQHDRLLNFYCRDDKQCICEQCTLSEHMGHNTVTAVEERKEREQKVEECLQKARCEIHERELILQKISKTSDQIKDSSNCAVDASRSVFSELTVTLENMKEELNKIIQDQETALLSQAQLEEKQQKLVIWSLQAMEGELEALSHVKDDIPFIMKSQPVVSQQEADPVTIHVNENLSFEFVTVALNKVKDMLEDGCKVAIENIQQRVRNVPLVKTSVEKQKHPDRQVWRQFSNVSGPRPQIEVRQPNIPMRRQDFMRYACSLTLDVETAHQSLTISDDNTRVYVKRQRQKSSPKRFDCWEQVLGKEGLRGGRFYWEVEWSGKGVFIGMALEGIARKGEGAECGIGRNINSWCLQCSNVSYSAWHNDVTTAVAVNVFSPRIGIYLDHNAGSLTFYSISDKMTLLHRFNLEKFSGPLYPAFGLGLGLGLQSWIKIYKL